MSQVSSTEMEWKGRTGPFTILLNPGVFSPTHTSRTIADALEIGPDDTVIDVGCGSGVLSFVAARMGAKRVIGCDISEEAVEAATKNAKRLGLDDRVEFRAGSLLDPVRDVRATVLIGDVSGIPDEIAQVTGWFPDGRAGGPTGAELPRLMLAEHRRHPRSTAGGSTCRPARSRTRSPSSRRRTWSSATTWCPVIEREFPLPDIVGKSVAVARMMKEGLLNLHRRGSRWLWRLQIWRCVRT